ncbi:MAG TPA: hypothetical protein VMY59_08845 [Candidatus Thermoplasmatota archaeon]|nr:hypothetical protein [Candidatus Thermoplasmatota archaeon]
MVKKRSKHRKPVMSISTSSKYCTGNNKYNVHWGTTSAAENRNRKSFTKRTAAARYVRGLKRKYGKKYKIDYMYLAD